jgi:hypothetical protein
MRIVEAELHAAQVRVPNPWSLVESPEEFWADLGTHGRQLLKTLLESTLEARRDEWVRVGWYEPAAGRRTCRDGYYRRKRWDTKLGPLRDGRVPRCRASPNGRWTCASGSRSSAPTRPKGYNTAFTFHLTATGV